MGITVDEELAFRFLSLFYFYWYPLPVKWNFKTSKLVSNSKPLIKCVPLVILLIIMWAHGWATIGVTVYLGTTRTPQEFPRINTAVHVTCGSILIIGIGGLYIFSRNFKTIVLTVDNALDITDSVRKEYYSQNDPKVIQFGTLLPSFLIPTWCVVGLGIPFCCLYTDLDVTYYIFELLFPSPEHRPGTIISAILLARFVFNFLIVLETVRCAMFVISVMFILLDRATKSGKILLKRCRNVDRFCFYYKIGLILFRGVEHEITICVYLCMFVLFWAMVICFWVCVKCNISNVSFAVYFIFGIGGLTNALGHVVVLPVLCRGLTMAVEIVKFQQLVAELRLSRIKSRAKRIALKKIKSVLPIRLKYGSFWYIDEDFAAEYFWLIITRSFDAILLGDF